jgi:glycosyltransferase involved in cell wall biosynthesis
MDRLAATDSRLKVIHVTQLPDGWLGKCHALSVGAKAASGEFLLFTDGDVLFEPETIRLAAGCMTQSQLDHLCLLPMLLPGTYFETALVCYFSLVFTVGTQPWLVRTSWQRAYVGVGAFNMVRRSVYEAVGGHAPIRLDILDDVKLGKLLKHAGYRSDVLMAEDLVRVRWQISAWGVIRGLEKNGFASLDYSVGKLIVVTLVSVLIVFVPYLALCVFRDARLIGYAVAVTLAHVLFARTGNSLSGGWRVAPVLPLAAAGFLFAFIRSAWITLRQGGVRWRDTFYPLAELRRNIFHSLRFQNRPER